MVLASSPAAVNWSRAHAYRCLLIYYMLSDVSWEVSIRGAGCPSWIMVEEMLYVLDQFRCLYVLPFHQLCGDRGVKWGTHWLLRLSVKCVYELIIYTKQLQKHVKRTFVASVRPLSIKQLIDFPLLMFHLFCRLLQDHHGVQSRSDCSAVCRLLHSSVSADGRKGSPDRRYEMTSSVLKPWTTC